MRDEPDPRDPASPELRSRTRGGVCCGVALAGAALFCALFASGCYGGAFARSADLLARDLPTFVGASAPAADVSSASWAAAAAALQRHARELREATR